MPDLIAVFAELRKLKARCTDMDNRDNHHLPECLSVAA